MNLPVLCSWAGGRLRHRVARRGCGPRCAFRESISTKPCEWYPGERSLGFGARGWLVTAEIACAFVLAVGAGLLGRSLEGLLHADRGYDPRNILTQTAFAYGYPDEAAVLNYYSRLVERVRAIPGVEGAAMVSTVPLSQPVQDALYVEGRPLPNEAEAPVVDLYYATPDYFRVMKIPLLEGRFFNDGDGLKSPAVALISKSCARSQFQHHDPIGRRIRFGGRDGDGNTSWAIVIGVVGDVWQHGADDGPGVGVYLPQSQHPWFYYRLLARTSADPWLSVPPVRAAMRDIDPTQPVFHVQPMEAYVTKSLADRIFALSLAGWLGLLALALAAVGIYGVLSYSVSLQTREIGIRMALGAERASVLRLVWGEMAVMLGWGLAAGLPAAIIAGRYLGHLLFGVEATDATNIAIAVLVVVLTGAGAVAVPTLRAVAIDPAVALRHD